MTTVDNQLVWIWSHISLFRLDLAVIFVSVACFIVASIAWVAAARRHGDCVRLERYFRVSRISGCFCAIFAAAACLWQAGDVLVLPVVLQAGPSLSSNIQIIAARLMRTVSIGVAAAGWALILSWHIGRMIQTLYRRE
jgi:hypothetical protein